MTSTSEYDISFMTANFVARQLGYQMTGGWGQGDEASNDYFRPLPTFGQRFEQMLQEVVAMGFTAIDLWLAHLNPNWATAEHVGTAQALLAQHDLSVVSLAGWFGSTMEEFQRSCRLAVALDCRILGGMTSLLESDRAGVAQALQEHGLQLGLENHPEKTPQALLAKIGAGPGPIGATVDTGWFGTQGYDAAQALRELQEHLVHVHLKDVLAPGEHETCGYGQGIVPLEECVRALVEIGYDGAISVEHEPEQTDPTPDVIASHELLQRWLQEAQNG